MAQGEEIHFGRFRLHPVQGLWRSGHAVHLTPKSLALLRTLAERPGELVTKDELLNQVWPQVVVTDASLATCIQELRKALQDDARRPRYIETVHRRGYRFVGRAVVAGSDTAAVLATSEGIRAAEPIVGRHVALDELAAALDYARGGVRQVAFVRGEAGIGKTTLVETFVASVHAQGGVSITRGECVERYGAGEAYQPLLEALTRLCRHPGNEQLVATLRKYAPTWLAQLPALQTGAEYRTLQRRTVGVTPPRMLRELNDALEAMSAREAIVLVLEDLHWSDVSTYDWISAFARRRESARVLLIGTYRWPDTLANLGPLQAMAASLRVKGYCREVVLGGLDEPAVMQYVAHRFPAESEGRGSLENLARLVHRHTEGNPLFIVNVLHDLVSRGLLVEHARKWSARSNIDLTSLRIPEDVRRTIELQLNRLSSRESALLAVASTCAANCPAAAVAAGADVPVSEVESTLGGLARQRFFLRELAPAQWPDGTVTGNFEFLHALYREVLNSRITPARSAELHRLIGTRLEAGYGARAPEIAAELAMHFERAGDRRRAIVYLGHAGRTDQLRSAHREANTHLRSALALLSTEPESLERDRRELPLRIALGSVLLAMHGFGATEVENNYSRARELCRRVGNTEQLSPVLWGLWLYYLDRGPLSSAGELADALSDLGRSSQDPVTTLQAHHAQWPTQFCAGDMAATDSHATQGLALYDRERHSALAITYGGHDTRVCAQYFMANAAVLAGRPETAKRTSDEAIAYARDLEHPFTLALALVFGSLVHQWRRDVLSTRERAVEAASLAREHSFPLVLGWASIMEGWAIAEAGEGARGVAMMRKGLGYARSNGSGLLLPSLLCVLAETELKCGRLAESRDTLAEALSLAERRGEQVSLPDLHRVRGEIYLAAASGAESQMHAERHLLESAEHAHVQGAWLLELRASIPIAQLWSALGKRPEARALLENARAGVAETLAVADIQHADALLAQL